MAKVHPVITILTLYETVYICITLIMFYSFHSKKYEILMNKNKIVPFNITIISLFQTHILQIYTIKLQILDKIRIHITNKTKQWADGLDLHVYDCTKRNLQMVILVHNNFSRSLIARVMNINFTRLGDNYNNQ